MQESKRQNMTRQCKKKQMKKHTKARGQCKRIMDLVQGFQGLHFVLGIKGGFGRDSKGFRGVYGGFVGFT